MLAKRGESYLIQGDLSHSASRADTYEYLEQHMATCGKVAESLRLPQHTRQASDALVRDMLKLAGLSFVLDDACQNVALQHNTAGSSRVAVSTPAMGRHAWRGRDY